MPRGTVIESTSLEIDAPADLPLVDTEDQRARAVDRDLELAFELVGDNQVARQVEHLYRYHDTGVHRFFTADVVPEHSRHEQGNEDRQPLLGHQASPV
jgi:hypothetical protein